MAGRRIPTTRKVLTGKGAQFQVQQLKRIARRTFTLVTTGDTDQDLASTDNTSQKYVDLNMGGPAEITKAKITNIDIYVKTAAGTVAAAVIGISTATLGTGTVVVTPAALTGMTAADLILARTVIANIVVTTGKLYVYQTTDSANAGTIEVIVEFVDLTNLE